MHSYVILIHPHKLLCFICPLYFMVYFEYLLTEPVKITPIGTTLQIGVMEVEMIHEPHEMREERSIGSVAYSLHFVLFFSFRHERYFHFSFLVCTPFEDGDYYYVGGLWKPLFYHRLMDIFSWLVYGYSDFFCCTLV